MVTLIYCMILIPIILYVLGFGYETILSIQRAGSKELKKGEAFAHATWEITHTSLIYAFVVFMITHASLLPLIATQTILPLSIFMIALMLRGVLYLYLFYGDIAVTKINRLWHILFAFTHVASLGAILWAATTVAVEIMQRHFIPDNDGVIASAIVFVPVILICIIPIYWAYRGEPKTSRQD